MEETKRDLKEVSQPVCFEEGAVWSWPQGQPLAADITSASVREPHHHHHHQGVRASRCARGDRSSAARPGTAAAAACSPHIQLKACAWWWHTRAGGSAGSRPTRGGTEVRAKVVDARWRWCCGAWRTTFGTFQHLRRCFCHFCRFYFIYLFFCHLDCFKLLQHF